MKSNRGFTLLELMTALAITSMLVAMLFAAFNQASRAWTSAEKRVDTFQTGRAVLDLMTRDLAQTFTSTRPLARFAGVSSNRMDFIAAIGGSSNTDLSAVSYEFVPGATIGSLVRWYYPGWNPTIPVSFTQSNDLTDATVLDCTFTYTYYDTNLVSHTSYNVTNAPAAIQISLRMLDQKSAKLYASLPVGSAAAVNIARENARQFSTLVYIPVGAR